MSIKAVYKYPLEIQDEQVVLLPTGAKILTVQAQKDRPCLWALVNPTAPNDMALTIRIFGTGHKIQDIDSLEYISTFQSFDGLFVLHVFVQR